MAEEAQAPQRLRRARETGVAQSVVHLARDGSRYTQCIPCTAQSRQSGKIYLALAKSWMFKCSSKMASLLSLCSLMGWPGHKARRLTNRDLSAGAAGLLGFVATLPGAALLSSGFSFSQIASGGMWGQVRVPGGWSCCLAPENRPLQTPELGSERGRQPLG